jgi:hypothetical protein
MPFGILDTQYIDLPAGLDASYLEGLRTRAGVDFADILRELDSRLAALNNSLDPMVAGLIAVTDEVTADGTGPVSFVIERAGEYTIARPQMTEGQATMLPLYKFDVTLGFTEDGLESTSLRRLFTNVDSLFLGMRNHYRKEALRRLFDDAEVRVDNKTVVKSPGFAGSGTGDNVFSRPYPDGLPLPGGYTHYYRDTTANRAAVIKSARNRLKKWQAGPFELIAPQTEIDALVLINPGNPQDGFVSAGSALVRNPATNAEAQVDADIYLGVLFGDILVRKPIEDYSDPNIAIYKSFGPLNAQNPLAWRYDPLHGRNAIVRSRSLYPLADANVHQKFGIGVNNRTAAALIRIDAAGGYVKPNIA